MTTKNCWGLLLKHQCDQSRKYFMFNTNVLTKYICNVSKCILSYIQLHSIAHTTCIHLHINICLYALCCKTLPKTAQSSSNHISNLLASKVSSHHFSIFVLWLKIRFMLVNSFFFAPMCV